MSETPSITLSQHHLPIPPRRSNTTTPMAIPRAHQAPPPPLPPPPFIPDLAAGRNDPGWQWGNDPNGSEFGRASSVKPGSSLLGGGIMRKAHNWQDKEPGQEDEHQLFVYRHVEDKFRRGSSLSTITVTRDHNDMGEGEARTPSDEGTLSRLPSNQRLQGERQLEQRTLEASSNTYDKQLLSRIGGPNGPPTPKRLSLASTGSNMQETAQLAHAEAERRGSQLRPLSMPERRQASLSSGAISPGFTGFWAEHGSSDISRIQRSQVPTRHSSLTFDDSISQRGSYDHSMFGHEDLMENTRMNNLNLQDRQDRSPGTHISEDHQLNARAGTKRRASSPARDLQLQRDEERASVSSAAGQNDLHHRRSMQQLPRSSPISRFHPNHSSLSSASSFGPRHGSLGSSLGVSSITSSATSYASGRLSPGAPSPSFEPECRPSIPYNHPRAFNLDSGVSAQPHQQTLSRSTQAGQQTSSVESVSHSRNGSLSQSQGVYICECCPKKPKKFETEEELRLHESEKQYTCAYCPNRFKNKNEAERHQNSLHLRRHSWSCAALTSAEAAFHPSSSGTGRDVCSYCGEEFPNPPQWDVRAEHLHHVHKFGDCNQSKKFFRADHFRQHLKHSHQGTSGKWTNMLEIACMKDEPLPEKRVVTQIPPPALMVDTTALPAPQQTQPPQQRGVPDTG